MFVLSGAYRDRLGRWGFFEMYSLSSLSKKNGGSCSRERILCGCDELTS